MDKFVVVRKPSPVGARDGTRARMPRQRAGALRCDHAAPLGRGGEPSARLRNEGERAIMNSKQSHSRRVRDCAYEAEKAAVLPGSSEVT